MNPDDIQEQILITSDGMLTRATNVPSCNRARKITVSTHIAANSVREITVNIGTTGKFLWRSDYPQMTLSADLFSWVGGMWLFVDMSTYYSISFVAGKNESQAVSADVAKTATHASVQQLRQLLNHWLRIRPGVTLEVTDTVYLAMIGEWSGAQAWRAIKVLPITE